jgi:hypothetical protein
MLHHDQTGVAGQAPRRFRGNVLAVLERGLPGCLGISEHRGVDVNDHLVALARRPRIDTVMERSLGEQCQRIGLLLLEGRRFRGNVRRASVVEGPLSPLIQGLARRGQCLDQQLTDLGLEASTDCDHAVLIPIHMERAATMPGG